MLQAKKHTGFIRARRSFSLVEMIIALTLVSVVLVSALAFLNYNLSRLSYTHDSLVASYLAQEGIELVIAKRNSNWLKGNQFNTGLSVGTYIADYTGVFEQGDGSAPLQFEETIGFQYEEGSATSYSRVIEISYPNPETMKVQSRVTGASRGIPLNVIVEDNLFNWFYVPAE